jgi:hypothetical protein
MGRVTVVAQPGGTAIFARFRNFYLVMELATLAMRCDPRDSGFGMDYGKGGK